MPPSEMQEAAPGSCATHRSCAARPWGCLWSRRCRAGTAGPPRPSTRAGRWAPAARRPPATTRPCQTGTGSRGAAWLPRAPRPAPSRPAGPRHDISTPVRWQRQCFESACKLCACFTHRSESPFKLLVQHCVFRTFFLHSAAVGKTVPHPLRNRTAQLKTSSRKLDWLW